MKKVAIHLATGFEEVEAISIIDVLRRAGLKVITVSMEDKREVTGSHQIQVIADTLFSELDYHSIDALILPGGMPGAKNLDAHAGLKEQILQFDRDKKLLGAICAAPLVFGHLDILKNKEAVCYPGHEQELYGAKIQTAPVAQDGHVVTSRGVGTALLFSLKLVELLVDKEKAQALGKAMLVEM